jgi:response regulator NasT
MKHPLRIAVADDEPDMRDYFRKILSRMGHQVVAVAANGRELVEQCRAAQPDLLITDIKMPEMDGIDAAVAIYEERPLPIILVSAYHDPAFVGRAEADHVMGYLVKPIKQADLEPVIALAVRRFEQLEALRREGADLRQALVAYKVIEEAKVALMKQANLAEAEALARVQQLASEKGRKLVEVAEMILRGEW